MGFFSSIKKFLSGKGDETPPKTTEQIPASATPTTATETPAAPLETVAADPTEPATAPLETAVADPTETPASSAAPSPQPTHDAPQHDAPTPSAQTAAPVMETTPAQPPASVAEPTPATTPAAATAPATAPLSDAEQALTVRLREAEPRLSVWLDIVLDGLHTADETLWHRLDFLLQSLEAPQEERHKFIEDFKRWLQRMEYVYVDEFRSELQYRLALALDLEDEEDERSRLLLKLSEGLARTREQFTRRLDALFTAHGALDNAFWEEMEELFLMADVGYEPAAELIDRLKNRAHATGVTNPQGLRPLLQEELEDIFRTPRRISAVNPPEVVLFIGVNGVGKTTTIAKLAHRDRMQGKKVLIAAADTFRAAATEQLGVWAERVGADFHRKEAGADPAAVAYEAMDRALAEGHDVVYVDTAGRLQTKTNLMEELKKIRNVLGKKHPGAPHRSVLVIDATTGQNALSQTRLFKEAAGVDEVILTKLDGTAKGGVAIAVAMQFGVPITFVGLGEKLEDLRPFNGKDFASALLGDEKITPAA